MPRLHPGDLYTVQQRAQTGAPPSTGGDRGGSPGEGRPSTHANVVAAATRVFLRRGYRRASMDAIAREAGVSKQTIYNNFGNKESLFAAIARERCDRLIAALDIPDADTRAVEDVLVSMGRQFLELMLDPASLDLYRTLIAEANRFPELGRLSYDTGPRRAEEALAGFLAAQSSRGRIAVANPRRAAEQFFGMLKGNVQLRALLGVEVEKARGDIDQLAADAVALFLRALRT